MGIIISNSSGNIIQSNEIWGNSQDDGIHLVGADNDIVRDNIIRNNNQDGISVIGNDNGFINNAIYSNERYGIYCNSDIADGNIVISNSIWGMNQNIGINIEDADDIEIKRNLIYRNAGQGIYVNGTATNTIILHNTVYSNDSNGMEVANSSSAFITNNILTENTAFGLANGGASALTANYNLTYGNISGDTSGTISGENKLIIGDPMLNQATFEITIAASSAVDHGINRGESFYGGAPDLGAIESLFTFPIPTDPEWEIVSNVTTNSFYVRWTDSLYEYNYHIWLSNTLDGTTNGPGTLLPADMTEITAPDITTNTPWIIKLYATNDNGRSAIIETNVHTLLPPPSDPTAMYFTSVKSNEFWVNWTPGVHQYGYQLYISNHSSTVPAPITMLPKGFTSMYVNMRDPDTIYTIRLIATNTAGSATPLIATVRTHPAIPYAFEWSSITGVSTNAFTVNWNDTTYETNYHLWISNTTTETVIDTQNFISNTITYSASSLTTNTTYIVKLYAENTEGQSATIITNITTYATGPAAPSDFTADSISTNQILLSWTDNAGDETGYLIYWNTNFIQPSAANIIVPADSVSNTASGFLTDTTYYFWIAASNENGFSAAVTASEKTWPSPLTPPEVCESISTVTDEIYLCWHDMYSAGAYNIYISSNVGAPVATTSDTNITLTGLTPTTIYVIWVEVTNEWYTNITQLSVTTVGIPAQVTGVECAADETGSVKVTWLSALNAESYIILYNTSTNTNDASRVTVGSAETSRVISGFDASTTYSFWVIASNSFGKSLISDRVEFETPASGTGIQTPNPIINDGTAITFTGMPASFTIQVFNSASELVYNGNEEIFTANNGTWMEWTGANDNGDSLSSGVYFIMITNNETGEQTIRKIVMIR